jgi:hypothetical protein
LIFPGEVEWRLLSICESQLMLKTPRNAQSSDISHLAGSQPGKSSSTGSEGRVLAVTDAATRASTHLKGVNQMQSSLCKYSSHVGRFIQRQLALTGVVGAFAAIAIALGSIGTWLQSVTGDVFLGNLFLFNGAAVAVIGAAIYFAASVVNAIQTFQSIDLCLQRWFIHQ